MEKQDCVRRSITAALRFAGIKDDTSWIPGYVKEEDLPAVLETLTKKYPWIEWLGRDGRINVNLHNEPGVFFYCYKKD